MAPNPRVAKAFRAMRELGIPEEKTKPVLKNLLKIYEKNWDFIEEDNYRTLADTIFDSEEAEAAEQKKKQDIAEAEHKKKLEQAERLKAIEEETQIPEEPERPLKRLRLRHQDGQSQPSPSCITSSPNSTLKKPKLEIDDIPYAVPRTRSHAKNNESQSVSPQLQSKNKGKQPVSDTIQSDVMKETGSDSALRLRHTRDKGKEPLLPQNVSEKRSVSDRKLSHGVRFKEPKVVKQSPLSLIKPKDEPITDDTSPVVVPLAVVRPESLTNGNSLTENDTVKEADQNQPLAMVPDESTTKLDIATSSSGEVKISLTCNSVVKPNLSITDMDSLFKTMEDKCLKSYKIMDPNFSMKKLMKDMCEYLSDIETATSPPTNTSRRCCAPDSDINGSVNESQPSPENDSENDQETDQNDIQNTESNNQSTADVITSSHDVNDIAKGQEPVIISLVNEVNTERPPSFHYIPQNAVFQNAYVNFSLARISDDNCCSTCFGDCLMTSSSSSTVCACALQSGGEFAYTKEGLVKEELLDECIKMNRNPQKHCLFYCKECPLERSKNGETTEPCKGHSVRSFIKECWLKCGCNKQCGNRVVQRGIQRKLQVFMTPGGKGWGLRTLEDLPKGAFVCEYVGEVLTNAELYDRVQKSSNKDEHAYPVNLDADWGAECELKDEEALCLDATYYGNVARFINHRCWDSTLVEIPVEVENPDHHYYHLAFFTTRKVKALEELTWDYGIDFDDDKHPVKAFRCRCGSRFCRNKRSNRPRRRRW